MIESGVLCSHFLEADYCWIEIIWLILIAILDSNVTFKLKQDLKSKKYASSYIKILLCLSWTFWQSIMLYVLSMTNITIQFDIGKNATEYVTNW